MSYLILKDNNIIRNITVDDRELIDPLNEDTYDDRVIVHSGIKSMWYHISDEKWQRAFGWKFKFRYYWKRNEH